MNTQVLVVIFSLHTEKLQVLLTRQVDGRWHLPGSAVDERMGLEQTALNSLQICTGLKQAYLEQLYTYDDLQTISICYFALLAADDVLRFPAIEPAAWCGVDDVQNLAKGQDEIIQYALRRLRYKLEYSAVGFELLPENFSLSELQRTYELILGEKLDKRNFRRRILEAGIIEPTPHQRTGEGRPARLFRYRPDAIAEVKARRLFP